MTTGINYVELQGDVSRPKASFTTNGFPDFKATIVIPMEYKKEGEETRTSKQYIKIVAYGKIAEEMADITEGTTIKIHGRLQERSYDGACKSCGAKEKKYWSDVLVSSCVVIK